MARSAHSWIIYMSLRKFLCRAGSAGVPPAGRSSREILYAGKMPAFQALIFCLFAIHLFASNPEDFVNPFIGTGNGGNTFPGAVVPFGMLQWSPETTRGDATRVAAPGGYAYDARRIRGFSLTHLSGTGCRGASGDIPFFPYVGTIDSSPSADAKNEIYSSHFSHVNEASSPGYYQVRLDSAVNVELTATARSGYARFTFPANQPSFLLIRTSDSEVGCSDATVTIDPEARKVSGSVTSGNFCGYLDEIDRHSYYTLYFVAEFDHPFTSFGTWEDAKLNAGKMTASGGTTYGNDGYTVAGKGSGAYVGFDKSVIQVRVGISYVSLTNAEANLRSDIPAASSFESIRSEAKKIWSAELSRIKIAGGTRDDQTIFYTALYHSLLHPNLFSDLNGEYFGFDGKVHHVSGAQRAQYANFSGWDVYRSQLQLITLLEPHIASDIAQSLFNQAQQNNGEWDRWTHNSGATHVMEGDASAPAIAGIVAFGGDDFDVKGAFDSLARAALTPTKNDLSDHGCEVECAGQRPSLDRWLSIHYIPAKCNAWGGAGETLEDATADFSLSQLARRLRDSASEREFLKRAQYWKNIFKDGYIQNRNEDGTWPKLDPASDDGFAEGSSAQYTWMIPFNVRGLIEAIGGAEKTNQRLDDFFHNADGSWALTACGGLKAEMDNEPSIGSPWIYLFTGRPCATQKILRSVIRTLWSNTPYGIPGNDDLGAMSSWYVWTSMGMYPGIPGRAELLLTSPIFSRVEIQRVDGVKIVIRAPNASADRFYIRGLRVNHQSSKRSWLPESFVSIGGSLEFDLSAQQTQWATSPADAPPSFDAETAGFSRHRN
jgi:predicted alpha-1,2-mannosidase